MTDQEIVTKLLEKLNIASAAVSYEGDRLVRLNLSQKKLTQLPPEIGLLTSLRTLNLSANQLTHLPLEIGQLTSLRTLRLDSNHLTRLPSEIGLLTNLQRLSLYSNQLSHLPPEIGQLTGMQMLRLDSNRLTHLPHEIWQLTDLKRLDLDTNQLSHLPPEIGLLTNLQQLSLYSNQLSRLPPEIGLLTGLQRLSVNNNQFSNLPSKIGQLTNLQQLSLHRNQLNSLPPEIGQLTRLQTLNLNDNQLSRLPPEIGLLTNLQRLSLHRNQLSHLPPEIGLLTSLQTLNLNDNQLSHLPPEIGQLTSLQELFLGGNQLSHLPPEIGQLTGLQRLSVNNNQLSHLPPEINRLTGLQELSANNNQLSHVPPKIGQLTDLRLLDLSVDRLNHLPPGIGQLTGLRELFLGVNQLNELPPEIGQLTGLQTLSLANNQLNSLPPEMGQLTSLRELFLNDNQLSELPFEIGHLPNLQRLTVEHNRSLKTLPVEIIEQGTNAILAFLRELLGNSSTRYEAKLLVVGEGGTGKSSLLRSLRKDTFEPTLSTTHGIEVDRLALQHPGMIESEIILNTWDFGGQQIYNATHQFFLTKRSLYLVTWNARLGIEQGRLHYWLETIKALAPEAPILLVATHIDERAPDLNYIALKEEYPQLVGHLSVSNAKGRGIEELQTALTEIALQLPIMGQPWPQKWLQLEERLLALPEHHIPIEEYLQCCQDCGVDEVIAKGTLGSFFHDLGKILYFQDDYVLGDLVVLKPNWITKAISRVLTDEGIKSAYGILQHSELRSIWQIDDEGHVYPQRLYPIFLRLMERFYLSYQIEAATPGAPSTRSLIPQLLPYQPPVTLSPWPIFPPSGQTQIEMRYHLSFVPAGIMSWFIVRTHLYTQNQHWREGVLLAYQDHYARIELNENRKELRLLSWGAQPHNFFTILMHTIDVILDFFRGLTIQREVPCICHWQTQQEEPCPRYYLYEDLVRRMEAKRYTIECRESFEEVPVPLLLYGIHMSTDQQVMEAIQAGRQEVFQGFQQIKQEIQQERGELGKLDLILDKLNQQSELICRNFTRQWNYEMKKIEAECPNTFFLLPGSGNRFNPKNWVSEEYQLFLLCQHPPYPHQAGEGYKLRKAEDWWLTVSPWLNHVVTFLKYAVPLASGVEKLITPALIKEFQDQLDLLQQIIDDIPELAKLDTTQPVSRQTHIVEEQQAVGPALRALHAFLKEQDPSEGWSGLHKVLTPDGNILWLCSEHRQQYEAKPAAI
jgi:Leucine-rich repeat (LRR) protein